MLSAPWHHHKQAGAQLRGCVLCQVVDEADRLLRQAYQDWLPFVVAAGGVQRGRGRGVLKFVASATLTHEPRQDRASGPALPPLPGPGSCRHQVQHAESCVHTDAENRTLVCNPAKLEQI